MCVYVQAWVHVCVISLSTYIQCCSPHAWLNGAPKYEAVGVCLAYSQVGQPTTRGMFHKCSPLYTSDSATHTTEHWGGWLIHLTQSIHRTGNCLSVCQMASFADGFSWGDYCWWCKLQTAWNWRTKPTNNWSPGDQKSKFLKGAPNQMREFKILVPWLTLVRIHYKAIKVDSLRTQIS